MFLGSIYIDEKWAGVVVGGKVMQIAAQGKHRMLDASACIDL